MGRLTAILSAVVFAIANPAIAQEQIPRSYPSYWPERPTSFLVDGVSEQDVAKANADEAACNAGMPDACANLAENYYLGRGRPQNRPVAELLSRKSCNADVGKGCFVLGTLLAMIGNDADRREAVGFHARACRLGWLEGCDAEADALVTGGIGDPDPVAAETLRRATCERGGSSACRKLAQSLMGIGRSSEEQREGIALIDRQCRAGDRAACDDAVRLWKRSAQPGSAKMVAEYDRLACEAGSASSCRDLGRTALAGANGSEGRAAALSLLERACELSRTQCSDLEAAREEPSLAARCEGGDLSACVARGQILSVRGGVLENRERALALLSRACEAGAVAGCLPAADLLFEFGRATGALDAVRAEAYLSASCTEENQTACEQLADELADGQNFAQNLPRALELYYPQCDSGRIEACDRIEQLTFGDPSAPLFLAHSDFAPAMTPDEVQESVAASDNSKTPEACATTTVLYLGRSYSDTSCMVVGGGIGGFSVRQGATPWQALLWRPETISNVKLDPAQRVLCGATVIRTGWVLTAAHCLTDSGGVSIARAGHRVRLGLSNPLVEEGYSFPIIRAIPHPNYDRTTLAFDVALVQYDPTRNAASGRVFPVSRIRLDPRPLGQRKVEAIARVFTYGWGLTAVKDGQIPDQLRGFRLKLRDANTCTAVTKFTDFERRDSVLCADDAKGAEGGQACYGDSGGPLITFGDADRVPTVIGVVSGGVECGTTGKPSRYVRVAHPRVKAWLERVLSSAGSR